MYSGHKHASLTTQIHKEQPQFLCVGVRHPALIAGANIALVTTFKQCPPSNREA